MAFQAPSGQLASEDHQIGDVIPWHYKSHIVIASFFASLTGTVLTVELLHHKHLGKSFSSRIQLLLCATAMGLVGIWCMHFVGNSAIILGDGDQSIQIAYSAGFTILSCILPVLGLTAAFYIAEIRLKHVLCQRLRDLICGTLAGLSVAAMHYCGNMGITNYKLEYSKGYMAGAFLIAIGDCTIALTLFFHFKKHWIGHFFRRCICALLLAVAVCGMHYTATDGCQYRLVSHTTDYAKREAAIWIASTVCLVTAGICLIYIAYTAVRRKRLGKRAQQVRLACAYFDQEGNILVTHDGTLPGQLIAERFNPSNLDDDFTVGHPIFLWLWKVTHDWASVTELIPRMRLHLGRIRSESQEDFHAHVDVDQSVLFRESFCVAASDLAQRLRVQPAGLGTLYDRITGTGVLLARTSPTSSLDSTDNRGGASIAGCEKGQVLFFVRMLSRKDIDHFSALGYRFAPPPRVGCMIAKTLGVPVGFVAEHIIALRRYADHTGGRTGSSIKTGTWLASFATLGRLMKGFDVLVCKEDQSRLPDVQVSMLPLSAAQQTFLGQYDLQAVGDVMADLSLKSQTDYALEPDLRRICILLSSSLWQPSRSVCEPWFYELTFNAHPILCHYGPGGGEQIMVIGLTRMLDIHKATVSQPDKFAFTPLSFFRLRSAIETGCFDVASFRTSVHAEFAVNLSVYEEALVDVSVQRPLAAFLRASTRFRHSPRPQSSDEEALRSGDMPLSELGSHSLAGNRRSVAQRTDYGGILLTTSHAVTSDQTEQPRDVDEVFGARCGGTLSTVVPEKQIMETKTYVDSLFAQAVLPGTAKAPLSAVGNTSGWRGGPS